MALAVGLAVIAVLVPYAPTLWTALAYEEERIEDFVMAASFDGEPAQERPDYVLFIRKRFDWLPGPDLIIRCAWCVESDHVKCPRYVGRNQTVQEGPLRGWRIGLRQLLQACTCPHPSHAEDSE